MSSRIGYTWPVTDPPQPAGTARARAKVITAVILAVAAAAIATTIMLTTSSGSPASPPTAAQAAHARGIAAGHALDIGHGSGQARLVPQVRLGLIDGPAGATGLAAVQLGYFNVQLGGEGAELDATPYQSPGAEEAALIAGRLDAAYLPPVNAVQAWQASHGAIRIISGAAARGTTTTAVLAVTLPFLSSHPASVQDLLKAQVQTTSLLTTDPTAGYAAAAAELAAIHGLKIASRTLTASLSGTRATCDPGAPSVLAQAQTAAAAGQLKHLTTLTGIYDLSPLNQLLRSAGMLPVTA